MKTAIMAIALLLMAAPAAAQTMPNFALTPGATRADCSDVLVSLGVGRWRVRLPLCGG